MHHHIFPTALGHAAVAWRNGRITGLHLPAEHAAAAGRAVRRRFPDATAATPPFAVAETIAAITRYFAGEPVDFGHVILDLGNHPDFTARVYAHVRAIPRGQTTTYGAVARALGGGPEAARAVGRAMTTNPVPLIIPCHRVLGSGNAMVGFSAPGGVDAKARMLALEGATVAAQQAFAF